MKSRTSILLALAILISSGAFIAPAQSEELLKPYILANPIDGSQAEVILVVKEKLAEAGLEATGDYVPYDGTTIITFTGEDLNAGAAKTEFGGFALALRLTVTSTEEGIQVAYCNPEYWANGYRLSDNLEKLTLILKNTFGVQEAFGSKKGMTAKKLRKYKYVPGGMPMPMPKFDDLDLLAEYGSYSEALQALESSFQAGKGGVSKIFRVDLNESETTLFGVSLKDGKGADETVMRVTDRGELKQSAYLPYEILVVGGKIYAFKAKFRIAIAFPDLSMGTFMKISSAPKGIRKALEEVSN